MSPQSPALRVLDLDPREFPGGVGVWGSLPAIYDTTSLPPEHGVHVHARRVASGHKEIDESFDEVNVSTGSGPMTIREVEAQPYVAGAVLGLPLASIRCPYCQAPHVDDGRFAIHPHQAHRCSVCNAEFLDGERKVGNPIMAAKRALGDEALSRKTVAGHPPLRIDQSADYCRAGILIWGSNPAILWTLDRDEEAGIHVHTFRSPTEPPIIDNTYESIEIDGVTIEAAMVRLLMVQQSLAHLRLTLAHVQCSRCGASHFDDTAPYAVEPHRNHPCVSCGHVEVTTSPLISNGCSSIAAA